MRNEVEAACETSLFKKEGIVSRRIEPADLVHGLVPCAPYSHLRVITGELEPLLEKQLVAFASKAVRTPFQAATWTSAFRAVESDSESLQVLVIAYADGEPVVVLPMIVCTSRILRSLTWQSRVASDYCAPLVAPHFLSRFELSDTTAMLRSVASQIGGIDLVYLPKMPELLGGIRNPLVLSNSWNFYAGAHAIRIEGNWESFYSGIRSQRTRQSVKRKEKGLRKMGGVQFVLSHETAPVTDIVQACMEMKARQLSREGHGNLYADQSMYNALVRAIGGACPNGAWAASLEVDGRSVAAAFGMVEGEQWLLYQFAMCEGPESKFSPGLLLLVELLKACVSREVKLLDLALGDESYKLDWCNIHSTLKTTVLPITPLGTVAARALKLRETGRRWLAKNPSAFKMAKRIKPVLLKLGVRA